MAQRAVVMDGERSVRFREAVSFTVEPLHAALLRWYAWRRYQSRRVFLQALIDTLAVRDPHFDERGFRVFVEEVLVPSLRDDPERLETLRRQIENFCRLRLERKELQHA